MWETIMDWTEVPKIKLLFAWTKTEEKIILLWVYVTFILLLKKHFSLIAFISDQIEKKIIVTSRRQKRCSDIQL